MVKAVLIMNFTKLVYWQHNIWDLWTRNK